MVKLFRSILLIIALLTLSGYLILMTETGLKISIGLAQIIAPGRLVIGPVSGTLAGPLKLEAIYYRDDSSLIELNNVFIVWQLQKLLQGKLLIHKIEVDTLTLNQQEKSQDSRFPLRIEIREGIIHHTSLLSAAMEHPLYSNKVDFNLYTKTAITLNASIEHLNVGQYWNDNFLDFNLNLSKQTQQLKLKIDEISGQIEGQDVSGYVQLYYDDTQFVVTDSYFNAANTKINITGMLGDKADLHWQANITELHKLIPSMGGSLNSQGTIVGSYNNPRVQAKIKTNNFQYNDIHFEKINLSVEGNLKQQKIQGDLLSNAVTANFSLLGQYEDHTWQALINEFTMTEAHADKVTLTSKARMSISKDTAQISDFCLTSKYGNLCSDIGWSTKKGFHSTIEGNLDSQTTIAASIQFPKLGISTAPINDQPTQIKIEFNTENLAPLLKAIPEITHSQGKLYVKADLTGSISKPKLKSQVKLQEGMLSIQKLGIDLTHIQGHLGSTNPDKISYQFSTMLGKETVTVTGGTSLKEGFPSQITIKGNNLLVSNTMEAKVYVSPDMKINTDHKAIELSGKIEIPKALFKPKDFSNSVTLSEDVIFIEEDKPIQQSTWTVQSTIELILGETVQFDFMGLQSLIRGHLRIQDRPGTGATGVGQLIIHEGKYSAYGQNLKIEEGRLLFTGGPLNNPGLNIKATKHVSSLTPTSNTKGGTLPTVASSQNTVGISISGTLKQPVVHFFSVPAGLSQSEILSLLVLGRPLGHASGADAGLLINALGALNVGSSQEGMIKKQVQDNFGLDELSINATENYDPDKETVVENTSLVLGKKLSPKLFINYSIGLLEPINVLKLNYQLNKRLRIESETDINSSGIDLFYSFSKD